MFPLPTSFGAGPSTTVQGAVCRKRRRWRTSQPGSGVGIWAAPMPEVRGRRVLHRFLDGEHEHKKFVAAEARERVPNPIHRVGAVEIGGFENMGRH